jgi:dienelactone hydrolase
MHEEIVKYRSGETECHGYAAYEDHLDHKRPAVLVAHAWRGQDNFAKEKARKLAELGYVGFAADIYGNGINANDNQEALALMMPLFMDRQELRNRICAAYQTVSNLPIVDVKRIGAIGFCFGGLTVIELLRSGAPVRGIVSFHGTLGYTLGDKKAPVLPISQSARGSALILHGHEDPLVSREDIEGLQKELTQAEIDWQMHIYGHAVHAFTNPEVSDKQSGLAFNSLANYRSWQSMCNFFTEVFK